VHGANLSGNTAGPNGRVEHRYFSSSAEAKCASTAEHPAKLRTCGFCVVLPAGRSGTIEPIGAAWLRGK
jgi:hypothetical protein